MGNKTGDSHKRISERRATTQIYYLRGQWLADGLCGAQIP